jgi:metal-responsive CopG/Arc/MetJ family transcriptional regulator
MPNKRSPDKKLFGVSFEKELLQTIAEHCKKHGINRVEFLRQAAELKLQKERKEKNEM